MAAAILHFLKYSQGQSNAKNLNGFFWGKIWDVSPRKFEAMGRGEIFYLEKKDIVDTYLSIT